jgi:hypothetical protein
MVDTTYYSAYAGNGLDVEFGPNLYLAVPVGGSSYNMTMKEIRIWAPMRAQADLLWY